MTQDPPCVGCGYCCFTVPCLYALYEWGELDCPALQWNGKRYICAKADEWGGFLGIGDGCRGGPKSWRQDVRNRDSLRGAK